VKDQIVAEIGRSPLEKVIVATREYNGHRFVDLRIFYLDDSDEWKPTKRGITVAPDQVSELKVAVDAIAEKVKV
jgi:hypothetical protein